jgi:hypothetical protein
VQYNRRARADTQLWINWKVRHGSLTHQLPPEFHTPLNRCQLRVLTEKVSLGSKSKEPPGRVPGYRETIKLAIILNHMPLDRNQWWWVKGGLRSLGPCRSTHSERRLVAMVRLRAADESSAASGIGT